MLTNVNVKNLALIKEAEINFEKGLNILTGETGAGKSIIIGSINIALGSKVAKDIIRADADYGLVELVFEVNESIALKLKEFDVVPEDDMVIISRKISNGRSIIKVNGETKTATELRKITSLLIDVHGQHDHQSLLDDAKHVEIIDKLGNESIEESIRQVTEIYMEYISLKKEMSKFDFDEEERVRECSFARFEIQEIDDANLKEGEDELIEDEYRILSNSGKILSAMSVAHNMLESNNEISVTDMLGKAFKELSYVSGYDKSLSEYADRLSELESLSRDLSSEISDYVEDMAFSEERLSEVEERLNLINKLKQKYGNTFNEIKAYRDEREEYLNKLENLNEEREIAQHRLLELEEKLNIACDELTEKRKEVASRLEKEIVENLKDLNFEYVEFKVEFKKNVNFSAKGNDLIAFQITTNPGETLKPLSKVASGGELSRIMLGLKTIMAKQDDIDTLIFDEIDTGISGRTAQLVAEKMNIISRNHQVICITHLPQIAAMADVHYRIEKNVVDSDTVTSINKLNDDECIEELARILGGAVISDTTYTHAREMKKMAMETK
ncbi:MAG: DNA repair protein RecN [Lachnospiraceae bacterium]|nr:DNA repair protein RecN [Lachnospiraceae bacterium]